MGRYDNVLHKRKCNAGMRDKLLRGEWIGCVPIGYRYDRSSENRREQKIIFNQWAPLIKRAFELKAEGMGSLSIRLKNKEPLRGSARVLTSRHLVSNLELF